MNFIHIAGHLGADPETRFTPSGKKVTTLRVATRTRKGGNDDTIWWRVTIWGDQFDKMLPYLKKGSPVVVFGEMQKPDLFTDREGKQQIALEITASSIQFSPFGKPDKPDREGQSSNHAAQGAPHSQPSGESSPPMNPYMKTPPSMQQNPYTPQGNTYDDEVPF